MQRLASEMLEKLPPDYVPHEVCVWCWMGELQNPTGLRPGGLEPPQYRLTQVLLGLNSKGCLLSL